MPPSFSPSERAAAVPLKIRCPWDERKALAVVDYGKTAGGQRQRLLVHTGNHLSAGSRCVGHAGLGRQPGSSGVKLTTAGADLASVARRGPKATIPRLRRDAVSVVRVAVEAWCVRLEANPEFRHGVVRRVLVCTENLNPGGVVITRGPGTREGHSVSRRCRRASSQSSPVPARPEGIAIPSTMRIGSLRNASVQSTYSSQWALEVAQSK
jgi:hypothetical protein